MLTRRMISFAEQQAQQPAHAGRGEITRTSFLRVAGLLQRLVRQILHQCCFVRRRATNNPIRITTLAPSQHKPIEIASVDGLNSALRIGVTTVIPTIKMTISVTDNFMLLSPLGLSVGHQ
jgi:hypothetical protein